jgi:hypothetical protein
METDKWSVRERLGAAFEGTLEIGKEMWERL